MPPYSLRRVLQVTHTSYNPSCYNKDLFENHFKFTRNITNSNPTSYHHHRHHHHHQGVNRSLLISCTHTHYSSLDQHHRKFSSGSNDTILDDYLRSCTQYTSRNRRRSQPTSSTISKTSNDSINVPPQNSTDQTNVEKSSRIKNQDPITTDQKKIEIQSRTLMSMNQNPRIEHQQTCPIIDTHAPYINETDRDRSADGNIFEAEPMLFPFYVARISLNPVLRKLANRDPWQYRVGCYMSFHLLNKLLITNASSSRADEAREGREATTIHIDNQSLSIGPVNQGSSSEQQTASHKEAVSMKQTQCNPDLHLFQVASSLFQAIASGALISPQHAQVAQEFFLNSDFYTLWLYMVENSLQAATNHSKNVSHNGLYPHAAAYAYSAFGITPNSMINTIDAMNVLSMKPSLRFLGLWSTVVFDLAHLAFTPFDYFSCFKVFAKTTIWTYQPIPTRLFQRACLNIAQFNSTDLSKLLYYSSLLKLKITDLAYHKIVRHVNHIIQNNLVLPSDIPFLLHFQLPVSDHLSTEYHNFYAELYKRALSIMASDHSGTSYIAPSQLSSSELVFLLHAVSAIPEQFISNATRKEFLSLWSTCIRHHLHELNHMQLSVVLYSLSKFTSDADVNLVYELLPQILLKLSQMSPKSLSLTFYALSRLNIPMNFYLNSWRSAIEAKLDHLNNKDIAMVLHTEAALGNSITPTYFRKLVRDVIPNLDAFHPAELVQLVYSCGKFHSKDGITRSISKHLLAVSTTIVPQLSAKDLGVLAVGLTYLGETPSDDFFESWVEGITKNIDFLTGPTVISFLTWISKLNIVPPERFMSVFLSKVESLVPTYSTSELSLTIYYLSSLRIRPSPTFFKAWCQKFDSSMYQFSNLDLTNAVFGLARMNVVPEIGLLSQVWDFISAQGSTMKARDISSLIYSLGFLNVSDLDLQAKVWRIIKDNAGSWFDACDSWNHATDIAVGIACLMRDTSYTVNVENQCDKLRDRTQEIGPKGARFIHLSSSHVHWPRWLDEPVQIFTGVKSSSARDSKSPHLRQAVVRSCSSVFPRAITKSKQWIQRARTYADVLIQAASSTFALQLYDDTCYIHDINMKKVGLTGLEALKLFKLRTTMPVGEIHNYEWNQLQDEEAKQRYLLIIIRNAG